MRAEEVVNGVIAVGGFVVANLRHRRKSRGRIGLKKKQDDSVTDA